ncbi:MAG: ATP-binding cassette domain-containing protein [Syntrophales bacterium]|nr:ATP-binding cassette domain-containing protein [Syntrophales bacterium]
MKKEPIITVRNLSHAFGEGLLQKEVLHEVSADFYPGEIIIITGPSGSGKTTFLTLVGALRSVQAGDMTVMGQDLRDLSGAALMRIRRRMGFIFQDHHLIDALTACQNVQMALIGETEETPDSSREKALECLAEVGLKEFVYKKPRHLSGGQKQRVAIARALLRRPEIILADEPTAALDKKTGREIVDLLHRLAKRTGCTILLVTHDNRILDVADRIIRIEDGCLEETQISMERIMAQIRQLLDLLAKYPACWPADEEGTKSEKEELHAEFIHTIGPLNRQIADLTHCQMPAGLAEGAQALQEMLGHCLSLEDTVFALGEMLFHKSTLVDATLADRLVQSTEFLLVTTAETLHTPSPDGVEMLKRLTEDRGELMGTLSDRYLAAQGGGDKEAQEQLFAATQAFARQVYFLHHLAVLYFGILEFLSEPE